MEPALWRSAANDERQKAVAGFVAGCRKRGRRIERRKREKESERERERERTEREKETIERERDHRERKKKRETCKA